MLNRNKTYLVLNPCGSPVAVSTRTDGYIIPGGTYQSPGTLPFSIDEIIQINSGSPVFKTGCLFFEPEYEKDIYEELRIRDWKSILREPDIEDIILHPTIEKLQKIIDIQSDLYFERVYGVYIGMKNANYAIPGNVQSVFTMRHKEFKTHKIKSGIVLKQKQDEENKEVEALKEQLASMQAMIDKLTANANSSEDGNQPDTEDNPPAAGKAASRPAGKSTRAAKSKGASAPSQEAKAE